MSFNISEWSIRKPVPTLVLFLVLTVLGLFAFPSLGIEQSPNIDVPAVSVVVSQPGADPSELESQVTKKIEDAVASLGNIDELSSTVTDGSSTTTINFVLGTNSDRATNDVRNAVAQIRQNLPQDINEPIVKRLDFAGGPIMTYAVVSDRRPVEELSDLVDRTISRALLAVPGVAQIQRVGGVDQSINVELNPDRLQALGITATQVNDQIRAFNANLPGGRADVGSSEQSIRTLGSAKSVETLKDYKIVLPQGGSVPLSTLGEVNNGFAEVRQTARLNNKPIVAFSVLRSTGSTLVTVEEGVTAAVKDLQKTLPADVKLQLIYTRANTIRESYQASVEALLLGALLAVVTIFIFLRDWRATLITAVALPLSAIPTFIVVKALGYTLNDMTLLALALVVGILVDDAIVEIENIERHMQMGKTPFQAALDASDEIGLAVVATTMSIVAVFAPVAFMSGIPGQYFRPFGITVSAAVLFSLLVARTITPLMAAYLMKDKDHDHENLRKDQLSFQYRRLLTWALKHRVMALASAIIFFIGSLMLVPHIPVGLFSDTDTGLSSVSIELPPGSTLDDTDRASQQATEMLLRNPAVAEVQTDEKVNTSTLYIQLKPREERKVSQKVFEEEIRPQLRQIPGVRASVISRGGIGSKKDLSLVLQSENATALTQAANALEQEMRTIPGLVEVSSSASLVKPEILIRPDPARAADQGVTVQQIARTAYLATLGDTDANLAKFDLPDRQIPIRVQLAPRYRNDIDTIKNLQIPAKNNTLVPLEAVADISFGNGPSQIDRYNRSRKVSIDANLQGLALGDAIKKVRALPALKSLPPDVREQSAGSAKILNDILTNFATALLTAVMFIYAVLVLLFSNFLHPITIMVALPLSIGGALLGLLITQKELGLLAIIGVVLLMGLVTKNSILLVDYALINKHEGKPLYKAVLESGVARLRPILMTTIAMIAGMVPIALGIGAGSEARSPMAIAVVGGLTTSTLLTLVVIPVIFTYMDGFQYRIFRMVQGGGKKNRKTVAENENALQETAITNGQNGKLTARK
jgi:hydrophobe/amphiphile efflux-1 (HAE1) family protein